MSGDGEDLRDWYRPRQYAKLVQVSIFTVWRWAREGHIEATRCPNGHSLRVRPKKKTEQLPPTASDCE